MFARTFVTALAGVASLQLACAAVVTLTIPGGDEINPSDDYSLSLQALGTDAAGRTTYLVQDVPLTSDSDYQPYTVTAVIGATDAIIAQDGDIGAVTQSCAWSPGASSATCVIVGPSGVDDSETSFVTATMTQTVGIGPMVVTLADAGAVPTGGASAPSAPGAPTSGASGASGASAPTGKPTGTAAPTSNGGSSGAPASTGTPSGASKTVVGWSAILVSALLGAWVL